MNDRETLFDSRYRTIEQALRDGGAPVSGPHDGGLHPVAAEELRALDRLRAERNALRLALRTISTSRNVPSDGWKHYALAALRESNRV